MMRVLIYGAGAVGLGIASCLLKSGEDVVLLGRSENVESLKEKGLIRTGIFGEMRVGPDRFQAVSSLKQISGGPFDYILVSTKSFDSEKAAQDLHAHWNLLGDRCCLLLFQNGWGNAEVFARYFEKSRVYNVRVITGFICPEPHHVDVTVHADAIHIGNLFSPDPQKILPLCEAISRGDIPCEPVADISRDLWAKMLFNCPLNSVGAVCGVAYGALGESAWSRGIMDKIAREIFLVMKGSGYSTYWDSPETYLDVFYRTLIPSTAGHYSSTLQDLRAGKRTEIDALNGAVVKLGKELGLDVPVNKTLYNLIKFLEAGNAGK